MLGRVKNKVNICRLDYNIIVNDKCRSCMNKYLDRRTKSLIKTAALKKERKFNRKL